MPLSSRKTVLQLAVAVSAASFVCAPIALAQSIPTASGQQWVSTWSDEFNAGSSDLNGFSYDTVDTVGGGWGNNELQTYTSNSQNVSVSTSAGVGALHIDAIASGSAGHQTYTSARIKTPALFAQAYGLFEWRAKFPAGTGLWPALWMMPRDSAYGGWPSSGEIDVFESKGQSPTLVQGTHNTGTSPGALNSQTGFYSAPAGFSTGDFHTYDLKWTPGSVNQAGSLKWYVDGTLYETQSGNWTIPNGAAPGDKDAPFDKPFYILMNMAVGGNYVGNPSLANGTYDMQVDYVRAYQSLYAGDANQNGAVNSGDFTILASHFNSTGAGWQQGDFNGDGRVNALDFNVVALNYGKQSLPSWAISGDPLGTLIPEPAALAAVALFPLAIRRRYSY